MTFSVTVPEDPEKPGRDVLGVGLVRRGHFIHEVMASSNEPLTAGEIGERAVTIASQRGARFNDRTFADDITGNHLRYMRKRGYSEQLPDKRWQLTDLARLRIMAVPENVARGQTLPASASTPASEVRTVDEKGRVLLSKQFANATVAVDVVSPTEVRIRKAVVIPESELPLLEDQLRPLSDRDRDFFLDLLDNPPEPTPALRAIMAKHKKRHG